MRKLLPLVLLSLGAFLLIGAAAPDASPEGYWLTGKNAAIIEIVRCPGGDMLCGRLAWFSIDPDDPNPQALDLRNPDPARRDQKLCGLTFLYGFKSVAVNRWEGGMVYDAESGNTYHANITLRPDGTLDLHGYIGISLLGRSEIWTRYTQTLPPCPTIEDRRK